jgi:flagellar basal body-associated protein FliL
MNRYDSDAFARLILLIIIVVIILLAVGITSLVNFLLKKKN